MRYTKQNTNYLTAFSYQDEHLQEFPKHPHLEFFARLEKTHLQQLLITAPNHVAPSCKLQSCSTRPCSHSSPCRIRSTWPHRIAELRPPKSRPRRGTMHPSLWRNPAAVPFLTPVADGLIYTEEMRELDMGKWNEEMWRWQKGSHQGTRIDMY